MGVTRENRDLFIYEFVEDDLVLLEQQDEDNSSVDEPRLGRRNANRNRTRGKSGQILDNQGLNRRKTGAKQARRTENFRQLLTLAEKDELGELQLDNMFEPSTSAFEKLFSEREKMKIWNDFVNRSEEEQETILHPVGSQTGITTSTVEKLDDSWEEIPDKRAAHPAFTAEECYRKVDRKLKDLLKRRQLPMGMLENLEEEIVSFFKEWPSSVFVARLASSYERMLIHALCQFLDLRSQSYDENGERRTQVENKHNTFLPPSPLLSQYLQKHHTA
ncbi:R3H domain-containing protein 4-like [Haliotis cracherodii]|uniref:R3H domain-containing protein 4-like n=1 Tax=Haliotis cracherodii TaxID=6455 RepID=UPI0039E91913